MIRFRFTAFTLVPAFLIATGYVKAQQKTSGIRPPVTIATDRSWDVSGKQTKFGEYPLPARQIAQASSPLYGGTHKAVVAETNGRSKIIPGSVPIWRNRTAGSEGEAYQFRKTVQLGADPILKATLEVNCDDVARVYINQRLASVDKRDGKLKDGYDDWYTFRSVTGFMYNRIYTYDVTDYFFTNVNNTILAEAASMAFDGSHAYFSARIVIEFGPKPGRLRPVAAKPTTVPKPEEKPRAEIASPPAAAPAPPPPVAAAPETTVFEAGRDPEIDKLRVGSILELGDVYFKVDDYKLDAASYRTLAALAAFMKRHPSLKIEVGGHTNLRPSDGFAADLSANRARSVMRYLTDNGVAAGRITHKGYGKSQPRVNAISKEADRLNQRVEIKVLEK